MDDITYAGIGARRIPGRILKFWDNNPTSCFVRWGYWLAKLNITLRSGGADGSDHAFEVGCDQANGKKEIFLPWKCFNSSNSDLYYIPSEAYEIAADIYGPTWRFQSTAVKHLMARNMLQVMGLSLEDPSDFVLCWTPDGCTTQKSRTKETGGTGQAIAYANYMDIPIFNFFNENADDEFVKFLLPLIGK